LDQLQERIRYLHYSVNTENSYLHWVRFFVRWHTLNCRGWAEELRLRIKDVDFDPSPHSAPGVPNPA
jgi:hypothetical protein